jgi:hypothetical protein
MVQGARVYEMLVLPMPTMPAAEHPQHNNKEWYSYETPSLVDCKQMGLCCGEQRIAWASRHGHTSIAGPCEDVRGKIKRSCNAGEKVKKTDWPPRVCVYRLHQRDALTSPHPLTHTHATHLTCVTSPPHNAHARKVMV